MGPAVFGGRRVGAENVVDLDGRCVKRRHSIKIVLITGLKIRQVQGSVFVALGQQCVLAASGGRLACLAKQTSIICWRLAIFDMTSAERRQLIQLAKMRAKRAQREAETREKRSISLFRGPAVAAIRPRRSGESAAVTGSAGFAL